MSLKKKIFYSFDLGLFVTGIILLYLGSEKVEIRLDLGLILISFSYFLFPFIDRNKKEKHFTIFGLHFLAFVICLVTSYGVFLFYNNNPNGTIWWKELLTIIFMLYSISFVCYMFISFIWAVYIVTKKLMVVNTNVNSKYKTIKAIIEKTTAIIVAISAFIGSITALLIALKGIISGLLK